MFNIFPFPTFRNRRILSNILETNLTSPLPQAELFLFRGKLYGMIMVIECMFYEKQSPWYKLILQERSQEQLCNPGKS